MYNTVYSPKARRRLCTDFSSPPRTVRVPFQHRQLYYSPSAWEPDSVPFLRSARQAPLQYMRQHEGAASCNGCAGEQNCSFNESDIILFYFRLVT
jgi:hypothetical protein